MYFVHIKKKLIYYFGFILSAETRGMVGGGFAHYMVTPNSSYVKLGYDNQGAEEYILEETKQVFYMSSI